MCLNDFGIRVVLYDLGRPLRSYFIWWKKLRLHNVDILEKFLKDLALNKKYIAEKVDFEIKKWPNATFNDLWGHTLYYKNILSL